MSFEQLQEKVLQWADDKDLLHSESADKQFMKFIEEVFEFKTEFDISFYQGEVSKNYWDNLNLEMGDVFVTLIILCKQLGLDPLMCLGMSYKKISKRTGKTINGCFIKSEDL